MWGNRIFTWTPWKNSSKDIPHNKQNWKFITEQMSVMINYKFHDIWIFIYRWILWKGRALEQFLIAYHMIKSIYLIHCLKILFIFFENYYPISSIFVDFFQTWRHALLNDQTFSVKIAWIVLILPMIFSFMQFWNDIFYVIF